MKATKMKLKRIEQGYSQKVFSVMTKITQQKLSEIERGLPPNTEQAIAISIKLGTTPAALFGKKINHR